MDAQEKIALIKDVCQRAFIYVGIFSCIVNILMLTVPLYMMQIFDRVLASRSYDTLIYLTLIAVGALLVLGLLDIARSRVLIRISHWLDNQLSPLALTKSADEILQGGQYASQSLQDISTIKRFLSSSAIFTVFDSPWIPIYLLVVFLIQPLLGFIVTIGAVILFLFALANDSLTKTPLKLINQQNIINQRHIEKTLSNAEVIQAMGMLPHVIKKWFGENEKILHLQTSIGDLTNLILSASKFIRLALQLSVLGVGTFLALHNQVTTGGMIACSIIGARALAPIEQAIGIWKQWKDLQRAYDRLREYLLRPNPRGEGIKLPKPTGNIVVKNLTYVPPGYKKPIIYDINFQLAPGEVLSLIGSSGAGKSTLARLLLGIWQPTDGAARLDGANVFEWARHQFGNEVGYLPQDIDLFDATIRENISRMQEADDESIIAAAKLAGAHELILQFPGGYDFNIKNFNLSGGQRQRIALARAMYGNPCLLVLDEPNASLDPDGEAALHNAIKTAKSAGKTIIVISHRFDLIEHSDKVMMLSQGMIRLYGPRDQVLNELQKNARKQAPQNDRK